MLPSRAIPVDRQVSLPFAVPCLVVLAVLAVGCSHEAPTQPAPAPAALDTEWLYPLPQGNDLREVAYVGLGKYFAVGGPGTVVESRGSNWVAHLICREYLECVWGASPHDVFVGGEGGALFHYNGSTWKRMTPPEESPISSISGVSGRDFWCVAYYSVAHYNGNGWERMINPPNDLIRRIWMAGPDIVYGIGSHTIYRKKADGWARLYSAPDLDLMQICGTDSSNVFVAAEGGSPFGSFVLLREEGTWQRLTLPSPGYPSIAAGSNGVWVHNDHQFYRLIGRELIQGPAEQFLSVMGIALGDAGEIAAVGQNGLAARWRGGSWSSALEDGEDMRWGEWTVVLPYKGELAAFGRRIGEYLRIDAGRASRMQFPPTLDDVNDAWVAPSGELFLVSDDGRITRALDSSGQEFDSGTHEALHGVHGTGASDVWAVGDGGTILHFDGTRWEPSESHVTDTITCVWAYSPDDVYASHSDFEQPEPGGLLHYDGSGWTEVASRSSWGVRDVWGAPEGLYLAGAGGTVSFYHEGSLQTLFEAGIADLYGIGGNANGTIYAVAPGLILRRHNGVWESLPEPAVQGPVAVHVNEDGSAVAVGLSLNALRVRRP